MADKEIGLVEVALEATVLWVRPPRAHVEAGLSHPKPRSACIGQFWSLEALLFQRQALFYWGMLSAYV